MKQTTTLQVINVKVPSGYFSSHYFIKIMTKGQNLTKKKKWAMKFSEHFLSHKVFIHSSLCFAFL